jgi:hypothetical protein
VISVDDTSFFSHVGTNRAENRRYWKFRLFYSCCDRGNIHSSPSPNISKVVESAFSFLTSNTLISSILSLERAVLLPKKFAPTLT